jgi:hypothetical protein
MSFLRRDGDYNFYVIMCKYDGKGEWKTGYLTDYMGSIDCRAYGIDERHQYSASGEVWQNTGLHGTTNLMFANVLLHNCRQYRPEWKFIVAERSVAQKTELRKTDLIDDKDDISVDDLVEKVSLLAEEIRQIKNHLKM